MPNEIHAGNGRDWTLSFTDKNNAPSSIDVNTPPEITMVPDGFAAVAAGTFDPATGQMVVKVEDNASIGDVAVTVKVDGDPTSGIRQLSITETFSMVGAGGATGVTGAVGNERPTIP